MGARPKKLLVLGAGPYQVPVIKRARDMGFYVITTDNVPRNPGHSLADKAFFVDTKDEQGVLQIARTEGIHGIIAPATDVAVPTASWVSEILGLVGVPYESARILCDKARFRHFLRSQGFPCPEFMAVPLEDAVSFDPARVGAPPWVLKPDCSSGSKGVFIVRDSQEYQLFVKETLDFAQRHVVVERYVRGQQGTAEGVIRDRLVRVCFYTDRQTVSAPYVATCGHRLPAKLSEVAQARLCQQIEELARLLNLSHTVFDCDFVATDAEVFILEISPRLGGNSIWKAIRQSSNFDILDYALRLALREELKVPTIERVVPTAVVLFGVEQAGALSYDIEELSRLREEQWVLELEIDYAAGHMVLPFTNGRNRVGEALVIAETREELDNRVERLLRRLNVHVHS